MKSASLRSIMVAVACLAAGALIPCSGAAQIAHAGEQDPSGRVYTQIVARVGELGSNSAPIPELTLYVVSEDGRRITLRTNPGGTAATWLPRARYRIVTPEPFQLDGRLYTWDTITAIRPGMGLVRLYVANAKSQPVPIATWKAGDAASVETIRNRQPIRSLTRDGVGVSVTISRDADLLWADVAISNRSRRRLDVNPQTFTLTEVAPKQMALPYRTPENVARTITADSKRLGALMSRRSTRKPEDILIRALREITLMPGQDIAGSVFFERDDKAREAVLRIPTSGVTFEVPVSIR
jgi:hypothetical protein